MAKRYPIPVLRSLLNALLLTGPAWADVPAPEAPAAAPVMAASEAPPATPACTPTLKPFKATYRSEGFGMELTVNRTLVANSDGSWTASASTSKLFFNVDEASQFTLNDGHIQPVVYRYQQTGGGKRNHDWHYDYGKNTVTNLNPDQPWTLPLQAGAQDRFSYQFQMGLDLQCNPNRTDDLVYFVPDRYSFDEYRFHITGHETLDTPLGKVDTIKLERVRGDTKRQDFIWVAPQWNYQLVLLRHIEKGETTDTALLTLELDGKPVKAR